jgi:hypothetical protein
MRVDIKGLDLTSAVKGKTKVFEFPSMPVEINIQVDIPDKKWDPLLQQKLQEAGKKKFDEIQKLFTDEMIKIDARVTAAATKDPSSVNLNDEQNTANVMSKQIANTLPAQVQTACQKVYEDLKKAHKELVKYNLKCAAKIVWASVKLSVAAARLGASHGADVTAYITIAKEIYAIGTVVYELAKSSDTLEKEVGKEYTNLITAVAKVKKETNNIKIAARQIADVEPKCKKVEEKLGIFRPKITGVDEKSHQLSTQVDKLLNAAEAAKKDLAAKPKALEKQKLMEQKIDKLITKIEAMQVKVQDQRKYADAVELTIKQFRADYTKGAATTVKVVDFLQKAKEMYDSVKEVVDVVKEIVELAV